MSAANGRRRAAAALVVLAAVLVGAASADAKRVRVFAVGPKFSMAWADSRAHFHDKLFALFDRTLRGAAVPVVQRDAADVASALLGPTEPADPVGTARDLVTLPEDTGLFAALTGVRGVAARQAPDLTSAIATLLGTYGNVEGYYASKFPSLAARGVPVRLLDVALTDTFGRVAVETFAELARRYRVYLEAGIDMVQDWHIVCVSRALYQPPPSGEQCDEENPAKVAALLSPDEPLRGYAYEATAPNPSNMALVFDPSGRLISKQVKTYLTPTELPGALDLVPGAVSGGLSALRTPVGTLGFVTSKDAWMPDVVDRLDEQHVQLLVQPEFFVGDTVKATGMWAPDNLKAAGFSDLLREPSIDALVLPSLTGNALDYSADAQSLIGLKPRSTRRPPLAALVGQALAPGLAQTAPWVVKDPLSAGEGILERRRRLAEAGAKLLPGGDGPACPHADEPGPCKGGQVESVLFQDVEVDQPRAYSRQPRRRRGRTPFSVNRPLAPAHEDQRNVALATRGGRAYAAFEQRRIVAGVPRDQVLVARSADGGAHWSAPVHATGRRRGAATEWWPSVSAGPDGTVWVAWQDDSSGAQRAYFARSVDGGRSFSNPVPVDRAPAPGIAQWRPSIAATGAGTAIVAWIDERDRFAGEGLPQANTYVARLRGGVADPGTRLDTDAPASPFAAVMDNDWAPSVAARGRHVLVAWLDFRTYDWRVRSRESRDGGRTFAPALAVDDVPANREALEQSPRAALAADGPLVAFTDYRKRADDATDLSPHPLYDIHVAKPGGRNRQADGHGDAQVDSFAPAIAILPGGDSLVAWQDHGSGPGDIEIARVRPGHGGGPAERVDDSGAAGWNQWRPALALSRGRVLAAWEDERDGPDQIYFARADPARIG